MKFLTILVIILFLPANAYSISATNIQQSILLAGAHENQAEAIIALSISLPDYPKVEPIDFWKHISAPYTLKNGTLSIDSSNIPSFLSELKNIPDSMRPLTIGIKIMERNIQACLNKKEIMISNVTLNVALYKKVKWQINGQTKPTLQFALKNIEVFVDNVNLGDTSVEISFSDILPETGNELFDSFAAGKVVEGHAIIDVEDF